ncbi:Uncharacterized protein TCM_019496 isoform 2, partial [Theobroma cacao]
LCPKACSSPGHGGKVGEGEERKQIEENNNHSRFYATTK